jgi:hypothetical protein
MLYVKTCCWTIHGRARQPTANGVLSVLAKPWSPTTSSSLSHCRVSGKKLQKLHRELRHVLAPATD